MAQLLGIPLGSFRFRGRLKTLVTVCETLRADPSHALHAAEVARATGIPMPRVNELLSTTPELFVRLPKRDGITRYRLATSISSRSPAEIEAFIRRAARTETWTLYGIVAIVIAAVTITAALSLPLLTHSSH
jgi:hypothetical protein